MSGKYNLENRRQKYVSKSSGTFRKLEQPVSQEYQITVTSRSDYSNGQTNNSDQQTNIINQQTKYNERAVDVQFLETTDQDKQIKNPTDNVKTTLEENVSLRSKDKTDFKQSTEKVGTKSSEKVGTKSSEKVGTKSAEKVDTKSSEKVGTKTAECEEIQQIHNVLTGEENILLKFQNSKRSEDKKHGGLLERLKRSWRNRDNEESHDRRDKKTIKTQQSSSCSSSSDDGDGQRSSGHEMYEIKLPHSDSHYSMESKQYDHLDTVETATEIHAVGCETVPQYSIDVCTDVIKTVPQNTIDVCTDVITEDSEEVIQVDSDYINTTEAVVVYNENIDETCPEYDNNMKLRESSNAAGTVEDGVSVTQKVTDYEEISTMGASYANSFTDHEENTIQNVSESIYDDVEVSNNSQNFVQKYIKTGADIVPFELYNFSNQTNKLSEIQVSLVDGLSHEELTKYYTTLNTELTQKICEQQLRTGEVVSAYSHESSLDGREDNVNTKYDSDNEGNDIIVDVIQSNLSQKMTMDETTYFKSHHQTNEFSGKCVVVLDSQTLPHTIEKIRKFDNQEIVQPSEEYTTVPCTKKTVQPSEEYTTVPCTQKTVQPSEEYTTVPCTQKTVQHSEEYTTVPCTQKTVQPSEEYTTVPCTQKTVQPSEEYTTVPCTQKTVQHSEEYTTVPCTQKTVQPSEEYTTVPCTQKTVQPSEEYTTVPCTLEVDNDEELSFLYDNQSLQQQVVDYFLDSGEQTARLSDKDLFDSENQKLHNTDNQVIRHDNQKENKVKKQSNTLTESSSKSSSKSSSVANSPASLQKSLATFGQANDTQNLPDKQELKSFDLREYGRQEIYRNVLNLEENLLAGCLFQTYSSNEPFVYINQDSLPNRAVTCIVTAPQTSDHYKRTNLPPSEEACVCQVEDGLSERGCVGEVGLREQLTLIMDRGFSVDAGESRKYEAPEINTETGRTQMLCHVIHESSELVELPTIVPAQPVECKNSVSIADNGQGDPTGAHTDSANTCVMTERDVCKDGQPDVSLDISPTHELETRYVKQDGKLIQLLNPRTFLSKIRNLPRKSSPTDKKTKVSKYFLAESIREPEPERKDIEIFTVLYQPCSAEILYIPKVNIGVNMDQDIKQHNDTTLVHEKQQRNEVEEVQRETLTVEEVQRETLTIEEVQRETLAVEEVQRETLTIEEVQRETLAVEEVQRETLTIEEVQRETLAVEEVQRETLAVEEVQRETLDVEEVQRETLAVEEVQRETLAVEEVQREPLAVEEVQRETLAVEEVQRETLAVEEVQRETLAVEEVQRETLHILCSTKNYEKIPDMIESVKCSQKSTSHKPLDYILPELQITQQLIKDRRSSTSSDDSSSDPIRSVVDDSLHSTHLLHIDATINLETDGHIDLNRKENGPSAEITYSNIGQSSDKTEGENCELKVVKLTPLKEITPVVNNQNEVHPIIQKPVHNFISSLTCAPELEHRCAITLEEEIFQQSVSFRSPLRSPSREGERRIGLKIPDIEDKEIATSENFKNKQLDEDKVKTETELYDQQHPSDSINLLRHKVMEREKIGIESVQGLSPVIETHQTVITDPNKQMKKKSNKTNPPETDASKKKNTFFSWPFKRNNKKREEIKSGDVSSSDDDTGETTVELDVKSENVYFSKEEETAFNEESSPRTSTSQEISQYAEHTVVISTKSEQNAESGMSSRSSSVCSSSSVNSITCHVDPSVNLTLQTAPNNLDIVVQEVSRVTDTQQHENSDNYSSDNATSSSDSENLHTSDIIQKSDTLQTSDFTNTGKVEDMLFHKNKHKRIKTPKHFSISSKKSGQDKHLKTRKFQNVSTESSPASSSGEDMEELSGHRTQGNNSHDGHQDKQLNETFKHTNKTNDVKSEIKSVDSVSQKSQKASKISKFLQELRSPTKKEPEVNFDNILDSDQRFDGQYHRADDVTQGLPDSQSPSMRSITKAECEETSKDSQDIICESRHFVVVAIDVGTTHSGYAFSFVRDPGSVYMMRRWSGEEPGLVNQKTLTSLLLTPEGEFHSFGYNARSNYLNLIPLEAKHWLYFSTFKMELHHNTELSLDTKLVAANGEKFPAIKVFVFCLEFFKTHALQQLSDQSGTEILNEDIRWVITVPAIWKAQAKQFMREAAYEAGMASRRFPGQLLIALEPEAASIYCRTLRMYQLVPDNPLKRPLQSPGRLNTELNNSDIAVTELTVDLNKSSASIVENVPDEIVDLQIQGSRYLIVDCGGGTVDITVHELYSTGHIKELYRATGGPFGSIGVDSEFEKLLCSIFSTDFIDHYKKKYPMGWVHLMTDFESRKRSTSPVKSTFLNVSLPFTFISDFKKQKIDPDIAVKRYGDPGVDWSQQGMLRLSPVAMRQLFLPTLSHIKQAIGDVLNHPNARDIKYMFLVGGFSESPLLQNEVRHEFSNIMKILIPQEVSLAILKGAVLFGLDPSIVNVRRSRLTFGVGILNKFDPSKHPKSKLVTNSGVDWCTDVFDTYVETDQPVLLGTSVVRRYAPANKGQSCIVLNIYSSLESSVKFITDPGVSRCGTLSLTLPSINDVDSSQHAREIQVQMSFGDTEISVFAKDVFSGKMVKAAVDFLGT